MIPYPHQIEKAKLAYDVLRETAMAYLAMEERTGKTLTALLVAEMSNNVKTVLVITKAKAIKGWEETIKAYDPSVACHVFSYQSSHKAIGLSRYDLIIFDEAHNFLSSYPKPSKTWKNLKHMCTGLPILYLSATPHAQGRQMLYHQFALSTWSPWRQYTNFYRWFNVYGKPYFIKIGGGMEAKQYDKVHDDKIEADVAHLFITGTRAELDFEHEPEDKVHMIELTELTKRWYNEVLDHSVAQLDSDNTLVCDSDAKLRTSLHQIEGGTIKLDFDTLILPNTEKIRYILSEFGDGDNLVIMYNYKAEEKKLQKYFKKAKILQATSFAEGVDLSEYEHLVIYSQDFSTARHTQRRARQANKNRATPITVHYLLVDKAISAQVYKTVSINKKNFVDSRFEKEQI